MDKILVIGGDINDFMGDCAYCGKHEELRPCGKDGAKICFDCGMKPENVEITNQAFDKVLDKAFEPEKIDPEQLN